MAAVGLRQGFSVFVAGWRQVPKVQSARADMARTALVSALGLMKRFVFGSFFSDRHSVPDTVSGGFSGFGADFGTDRSFPVRFLPWGRER